MIQGTLTKKIQRGTLKKTHQDSKRETRITTQKLRKTQGKKEGRK